MLKLSGRRGRNGTRIRKNTVHKRTTVVDYELLAQLLEFPGQDYFAILERVRKDLLKSKNSEVWYFFTDFFEFVLKHELDELQRYYQHTFRDTPNRSLYVGDYCCEDETSRGEFNACLRAIYREFRFNTGTDAADYLPKLLHFSSRITDLRDYESFLNDYLLYPILRLLDQLDNADPYRSLLSFTGNIIATEMCASRRHCETTS